MRAGAKTAFAKKLRRDMTDAERGLWHHLRMQQMRGYRFRRQHPLGPYIVDFACLDAQLIIELDGSQHLDSAADARRDAWCVQHGYRVLRFWNHDVLQRTESVLEAIHQALRNCPHPNPPPHAGEGAEPPT